MQEFKTPSEAIMDDSKALLKSCSDSFARCHNINDYIRKCFDVLDGKTSKLPSCFLRLDIAHWVKSLHRNKIWKDVDRQVKHFYLCCIGVIIISDNYLHVCEIVERMLKLANGRIDSKASHTILSKLVETHKTHEVLQYTDDNEHADDEKNDQHDTENESPSAITWFDKLAAKVLKEEQLATEHTDKFFNPTLNKFFKDIFNRLPLWSAVMKPHFKSVHTLSISNDTEARFQVIKNIVFCNQKLPIRPDSFVRILLDEVSSMSKIAAIKNVSFQRVCHVLRKLELLSSEQRMQQNEKVIVKRIGQKKEDNITQNTEEEDAEELNVSSEEVPSENWRGKGDVKVPTTQNRKHRAPSSILNRQVKF